MNGRSRKNVSAFCLAVWLLNGAGSVLAEDAAPGEPSPDGAKTIGLPKVPARQAPCVSWIDPNTQPRAVLLCIHGLSLHKGCFAAFGKEMSKDGIATYAMDMRGFGELKQTTAHTELDFDGCLADIKEALEGIHKKHPGLPVIILGESMGGAIALRATALYPDLVSGLISSVPARDRFGPGEGEVKVGIKAGFHILFGGFSKPMKGVAMTGVNRISEKQELRQEWTNDPLMRVDFSPKEFLQFDKFMKDNIEAAGMIKDKPVLFIQGTDDKLIRPAGTWKLFEHLGTPERQLVLSKNSEHLIFEEGQFRPDDLDFVTTWINANVTQLNPEVLPKHKIGVVAANDFKQENGVSGENGGTTKIASASSPTSGVGADSTSSSGAISNSASGTNSIGSAGAVSTLSSATLSTDSTVASSAPKSNTNALTKLSADIAPPSSINYWIELYRGGKVYRCNNKTEFKTGDAIRFHVIPESDGYISLVMKEGSTGKSQMLFPNRQYGTNNFLRKGQDYPVPSTSFWMAFDEHPGTEQLVLVFSKEPTSITPESVQNRSLLCYVSNESSGAKDLVPTRMKLTWDDPKPVMIPEDFSGVSQMRSASGKSSLVRLASSSSDVVAVNIALVHH